MITGQQHKNSFLKQWRPMRELDNQTQIIQNELDAMDRKVYGPGPYTWGEEPEIIGSLDASERYRMSELETKMDTLIQEGSDYLEEIIPMMREFHKWASAIAIPDKF